MSETEHSKADTKLAEYLEANRQKIFEVWDARVRKCLPTASPMSTLALLNSLPELFDGMIKTLAAEDPKKYVEEYAKELGKKHGEERSRHKDYNLNQVIEEYWLLRYVILEYARKLGPMSDHAVDAILDAITIGIRNATAEFVRIRGEMLTHANEVKSTFLTNVSHEIRTPLGAILGYADLLKGAKLQSDEYLEVITRNGKALSKLIDDVLDFSTVEGGHLEAIKASFALDELVSDVLDTFKEVARKKNISLIVGFETGMSMIVRTDYSRLRQILINIVGNAIKFTQSGSVEINVEPILQNETMSALRFTISDTGIGMSEEEALKIFVPFSQADNSMTRKFGGTGLGLGLSRYIARALGGDVVLKSCKKGKGCVFEAIVAAQAVTEVSEPIVHGLKKNLDGLNILLVEDSIDSQYLIQHMLEDRGAHVDVANNGQEGVDKAKVGNYAVVLMDTQMPVLDGHLATKQLREFGFKPPIIALTAHVLAEERKKTKDAGCNAHLTKPVDVDLLVKTIKEMISESSTSQAMNGWQSSDHSLGPSIVAPR